MNNLLSLFLSQSYQDCWDDYKRSNSIDSFPKWDYIILTASNEQQAEGFMKQIESRKQYLPKGTKFAVIPDKDNKRVGSGGATLSVIKYLYEQEGSFEGLRVLVIHSGGDSKRVPQYSALGKLFSPVPHELPDGRTSTLFDEFMICMSSVPSRIREGMLLLSGDVLLLFNPLQIDFGRDAAAISFKEDVHTGKNHGVFLNGDDNYVRAFLHKQSVETLTEMGAVNEKNCVDIDTGAVIFSNEMLASLYKLIDTPEGYETYVNDKVRLSLYGDFLYPLASDSTLEEFYKEKPEGDMCHELLSARAVIWDTLSPYRLKLLRLSPAKFIHFGTSREILSLMSGEVQEYKDLGWSSLVKSSITAGRNRNVSGYSGILSSDAQIGDNCYLEVSYVHGKAKVGSNVILSFIDIYDAVVPSNVIMHGLKERDGKFVARIYGINDNPKENKLFGRNLDEISQALGFSLWEEGVAHSLWTADIYPEMDNIDDAVRVSLKLYDLIMSLSEGSDQSENALSSMLFAGPRAVADAPLTVEEFKNFKRMSLASGFNNADPDAIIAWSTRMQALVSMDEIAKAIKDKVPAASLPKMSELTKLQRQWLDSHLEEADFSEKMRLYYYLGTVLSSEAEISACFKTISDAILESTLKSLEYNDRARIVKDKHTVQLPLRANLGGGWSDTPPYCIENGGTVLNVALLLNGEKPVEVTLERIDELKIIFDSRDMDVHGEFDMIEPLQETGNPFDPFALQKACLLACGIIPKEGHNLQEILASLGGGFEMHSEVTNVPKGSGLGTSSILSAACVKAVFEFMGIEYTEDDLYSHVLAMEQIMSTGGGWQDQVGGVTPGLKYISSMPALDQKIKVEHVQLSEETKKEFNDRFALIYTGQRRLARNLLRDVVGRYIGNEPESIYAHNEIQRVAALMRFELERGNVDAFAGLLHYHWDLSKKIDKGSTNTLIDQIFGSIDDLIDGQLVCGAGGGGFLQVVMKKGVSRSDLRQRLREVFQDSLVDVWDSEIVW